MTKRVRSAEAVGVRINETELGVMQRVAASPGGMVVLSVNELSKELGRSVATIRNALRSLDSKGLLSVRTRYLRNGGQLENEYELTGSGKDILDTVRKAS